MPQNLDELTRSVVLGTFSVTSVIVATFAVRLQFGELPKLRRKIVESGNVKDKRKGMSLVAGCLLTLLLMTALTTVLVLPVLQMKEEPGKVAESVATITSSINFCEEDFLHSSLIAEPTNVVSSFTSYVPLALFGLFGPSSRIPFRFQFSAVYLALLTIGIGSAALHSLLTAEAQGGDELPMLWYAAAISYSSVKVILNDRQHHQKHKQLSSSSSSFSSSFSSSQLGMIYLTTTTAATAAYIKARDQFVVFYILFSLYSFSSTLALIYLNTAVDWTRYPGGARFQLEVAYPLSIMTSWLIIAAVGVWVSEMLYCHSVQDWGGELGRVVWDRMVHPLWHFLSGLLAHILVQQLIGFYAMQQGWVRGRAVAGAGPGTMSLKWFGAVYVAFDQ